MKKIELDLKVDAALSELSEQIKALPRVKDGKIYKVPVAIQKRAVEIFHDSGIGVEGMAQRLGMSGSTIRTWVEQLGKKKKLGRPKKVKFTQVKVREEVKAPVLERKPLTLELSCGAKVHGLNINEIRELMAMDGGAR